MEWGEWDGEDGIKSQPRMVTEPTKKALFMLKEENTEESRRTRLLLRGD